MALDYPQNMATKNQAIFCQGGVPYGKELTESWANLQTRIKKGDFTNIYIGDYKIIQLTTGETVIMEVAGIDQYYNCADQAIGHHVDFISRDCLKDPKVFNSNSKNNGTEAEPNPWRASELFQAMNDESTGAYSTLPADLKPCIIDKRALLESRYSAGGELSESGGWAWNSAGKLWLPTEVEVFGTPHWGGEGYPSGGYVQYPIFFGGFKHIIKGNGNGGSRVAWWEATARRDSTTRVCYVYYNGYAAEGVASYASIYAPLCFRIG